MKIVARIILNLMVILSLPVMAIGGLAVFKVISPLIVISGSMEPEISVGSLIVSTKVSTHDLHAGDIASLPREDGVLVTHRIVSNEEVAGNSELRSIVMKGDANESQDQDPYVQSEALKPLFVVPAVGQFLAWFANNKLTMMAFASFAFAGYLMVKMVRTLRSDKNTDSADVTDAIETVTEENLEKLLKMILFRRKRK